MNDQYSNLDEDEGSGTTALIAAFSAFYSKSVKPDLTSRKPLRGLTAFGSAVADGSSPFILRATNPMMPASGRMWNVLSLGVYGSDAHTPVTGTPTLVAEGSVTNPAANATITSISAAALQAAAPPGTEWLVNWTASLQGTIAPADANNMYLSSPLGTVREQGVFPPVVGTYPQQSIVLVPGAAGINVQANGAASGAAAVYVAEITATPASGVGCIAELFVGDVPDAGGSTMPPAAIVLDNVGPGSGSRPAITIPGYFALSSEVIWCQHGESIYALVYDVPSGQQLSIVATYDDWMQEDITAMRI